MTLNALLDAVRHHIDGQPPPTSIARRTPAC